MIGIRKGRRAGGLSFCPDRMCAFWSLMAAGSTDRRTAAKCYSMSGNSAHIHGARAGGGVAHSIISRHFEFLLASEEITGRALARPKDFDCGSYSGFCRHGVSFLAPGKPADNGFRRNFAILYTDRTNMRFPFGQKFDVN